MITNRITVVEIDENELWQGTKVRNKSNGAIKEIFVIPEGKTIYQCVKEGIFDPNKHIDYSTVMLNKNRFQLVENEEHNIEYNEKNL